MKKISLFKKNYSKYLRQLNIKKIENTINFEEIKVESFVKIKDGQESGKFVFLRRRKYVYEKAVDVYREEEAVTTFQNVS